MSLYNAVGRNSILNMFNFITVINKGLQVQEALKIIEYIKNFKTLPFITAF